MATIKIERTKMIEVLKEAVATREAVIEAIKKAEEKYEKDMEKYHDALRKALKSGKVELIELNPFNPYYRGTKKDREFQALFAIPNSISVPEKEYVEGNQYGCEHEIEEINQTIRLLNLSDDAYVPATLYKSITKFL